MRLGAMTSTRWTMVAVTLLAACSLWSGGTLAQTPLPASGTPKVGDQAKDFTLLALDGTSVQLSKEVAKGDPLVLVVLRGWPGYQCPFCTKQFGDYLANAARFEDVGAHVLFIYPGPGEGLKGHAEAFTAARAMPKAFRILLDPDYAYTNLYGLRWNAPQETAYPSTFVVDRHGLVTFAQTSQAHGDRVTADAVLRVVGQMKQASINRDDDQCRAAGPAVLRVRARPGIPGRAPTDGDCGRCIQAALDDHKHALR